MNTSFYQERQALFVKKVGDVFRELVLHSTPMTKVQNEVLDMLRAAGMTLPQGIPRVRIEELFDRRSLWKRMKAEVQSLGDIDQLKFNILVMIAKTLEEGGTDEEGNSYQAILPIVEFGSLPISKKVLALLEGRKIIAPISFSNPSIEAIESTRSLSVRILYLHFGSGPDFRGRPQLWYECLMKLRERSSPYLEDIIISFEDGFFMTDELVQSLLAIQQRCPKLKKLKLHGVKKPNEYDIKALREKFPYFSCEEKSEKGVY